MKVLNLYAGIGGNRKLWEDVEVTAVEIDPKIAAIYQDFFPEDKVVIADAHQYLLDHYKEFDFIWSSPPCPTHSITSHFLHSQGHIRYPDMSLWQEIIFLGTFCHTKWIVENVRTYYEPLIRPYELDRHYFWSNVYLSPLRTKKATFNKLNARGSTRQMTDHNLNSLQELHGVDLSKYKMATYKKRKILRNMVYPPLGKHILDCARGATVKPLTMFMEKA